LGSLGKFLRWNGADVEPTDLFAFVGFFDARFAVLISAEIGGGDPVLFFLGQNMVNYIEKLHYLDDETVFLSDLSYQGVLEGLAKFDTAARKLPPVLFVACFCSALCQEDLAILVKDDGPCADTDVINPFFHGGIINPFSDRVYNHLAISGIF